MRSLSLYLLVLIAALTTQLPTVATQSARSADVVKRPLAYQTLINCVFFDSASARIPERYHLFRDAGETSQFKTDTLSGTVIANYREVLNVLGYRLRRSRATIRIHAYGDVISEEGSRGRASLDLARARAGVVRDYLVRVWGLNSLRIKLESSLLPLRTFNVKSTEFKLLNSRVDVETLDSAVLGPIVRYSSGAIDADVVECNLVRGDLAPRLFAIPINKSGSSVSYVIKQIPRSIDSVCFSVAREIFGDCTDGIYSYVGAFRSLFGKAVPVREQIVWDDKWKSTFDFCVTPDRSQESLYYGEGVRLLIYMSGALSKTPNTEKHPALKQRRR